MKLSLTTTDILVPSQDSIDNIDITNVTGNKTDTVAGDSLVSIGKQIKVETDKIDSSATNGLSGVNNSLAYRTEEIEKHLHNCEKWFGIAAVASGETHVADRMAGGIQPFVLTAGNDDFGAWVQVLGSSDTPVVAGNVKFDPHRYQVVATNSTNQYIIQFVEGESADIAAKIAAEDFCEAPYISSTNNADSGIEDVLSPRIDVGEKLWARCACIGSSGSTISVYYGIHEYAG